MTLRVLAVADSESFLRWATATLDQITADGVSIDGRAVIIDGPLRPSATQQTAATAGTSVAKCPVVDRRRLRACVETLRPDVVLVAATGPVAEMVALSVLEAAGAAPPVMLTGAPGVALPISSAGVSWRSAWTDGHIVHSPREVTAYAEAFARHRASPRLVLTRLPFLSRARQESTGPIHRIVFAPQAIVPFRRPDRVALLRGLATLHSQGYEVVVKLRARAGEQQTHYEALPFDRLWAREHRRLGLARGALRFGYGPVTEWLTPGSALLTVSSTAALESIALGAPTVVLSDFGVSEPLMNTAFESSGCLVALDDVAAVLRGGGPIPSPTWLAANYHHDEPSELGKAVIDLSGARRRPRKVEPASRPVHLYSRIKSDHPVVWHPARVVRATVGRVRQLR